MQEGENFKQTAERALGVRGYRVIEKYGNQQGIDAPLPYWRMCAVGRGIAEFLLPSFYRHYESHDKRSFMSAFTTFEDVFATVGIPTVIFEASGISDLLPKVTAVAILKILYNLHVHTLENLLMAEPSHRPKSSDPISITNEPAITLPKTLELPPEQT